MENEIFNTVSEAIVLLKQNALPIGLYMVIGGGMRHLEIGYERFVGFKSNFDEQVQKRISTWFWEPKIMNKRPEYSHEQDPNLKKSLLSKAGEAIVRFPSEFVSDKVAIGCSWWCLSNITWIIFKRSYAFWVY